MQLEKSGDSDADFILHASSGSCVTFSHQGTVSRCIHSRRQPCFVGQCSHAAWSCSKRFWCVGTLGAATTAPAQDPQKSFPLFEVFQTHVSFPEEYQT